MTDDITTRTELLLEMDREWEALERLVDHTSDADLVEKTDPAGWTSKDHLAHLAAYGHSMLLTVREGLPRWDGLGIDQELYEQPGWDEKNEAIRQQSVNDSLGDVRAHLGNVYAEMRRTVDEMSDDELLSPLAEGGNGETVMRRVAGSFPWHFSEHRGYIERILGR